MVSAAFQGIINISSFVGLSGAYAQPGYGASKAGLIGLTKSLALEGAWHSITVNAILPGFIQTEALMLHQPEMLERIKKRIAMNRLGKPEEVAAAVVFWLPKRRVILPAPPCLLLAARTCLSFKKTG